jgi:hypothetical protein
MKRIPPDLTRKCPMCGKNIVYKTAISLSVCRRKNSVCVACRPKKISKTLRGLQKKSTVPVVGKYTPEHNNDVSLWMKAYWSKRKNRQRQSQSMCDYHAQLKSINQ